MRIGVKLTFIGGGYDRGRKGSFVDHVTSRRHQVCSFMSLSGAQKRGVA